MQCQLSLIEKYQDRLNFAWWFEVSVIELLQDSPAHHNGSFGPKDIKLVLQNASGPMFRSTW